MVVVSCLWSFSDNLLLFYLLFGLCVFVSLVRCLFCVCVCCSLIPVVVVFVCVCCGCCVYGMLCFCHRVSEFAVVRVLKLIYIYSCCLLLCCCCCVCSCLLCYCVLVRGWWWWPFFVCVSVCFVCGLFVNCV